MGKVKLLKQYKPFATKHADFKVVYGSRGKGVTWQYARILLLKAAEERKRTLCTREFQNSINESVYHTLVSQIDKMEIGGYKIKNTEILHEETGSTFIFKGLRYNIDSIKSMEDIDICWVAEADKVPQDSWDKLIPTIRKPGSEIWVDFNPDQEDDPVYKMFVTNKRPDAMVLYQTYRDNPYLPDRLIREMEYCKENDYEKYLWVWEGKTRSYSDACIFHGKWKEHLFETPKHAEFFHGIDWGFANDPVAGIRCYVDGDDLYIDKECGGLGIEINELPKVFKEIPTLQFWVSRADSARPELISYMQKHGYPRMRRAKKGKGSIEDGIAKVRGFKNIYVHPSCKNVIEEFKSYKYKRHSLTDEILPVPEDKNNHWMDALRYALEPLHKKNASVGNKKGLGL